MINPLRSIFLRFRKLKRPAIQKPSVSFCISHQNRLEFIQKTLKKNLDDNRSNAGEIEFVVVDFNDNEDLVNWIRDNFLEEIKAGYLSFYHTRSMPKWSMPIAKNTTHFLAKGSIVTNLDCDNYTGPNGGMFVKEQYKKHPYSILLWQHTGIKRDGTYGRMSMAKEHFERIGGYDESFLEMAYQDLDFKYRAVALGIKVVHVKDRAYNQAIKHDRYEPETMTLRQMDRINMRKSRKNIILGKLKVNKGIYGIRNGVLKMDGSGELKPFLP